MVKIEERENFQKKKDDVITQNSGLSGKTCLYQKHPI